MRKHLLLLIIAATAVPLVEARGGSPRAEKAAYWVEPMKNVHARFTGTRGTFAQFGDSITVSLAFWAPLRYDPKGLSPEAAGALERVKKYMKPECWSEWRGAGFGNEGGMTIRWADDNVARWLEKHNPETAVIMFGSNDLGQLDVKEYQEKTRNVVRRCLKNGTVVILTTAPPRHGFLEKSRKFAEAVRQVAREEKVPLVDYFGAVLDRRPDDWDGALPKFKAGEGDAYQVPTLIARDGVHPSNPSRYNEYSKESLANNGFALRNYLTLSAYAKVIDHIVQSDNKLQAEPAHRDFLIDSRYLHLPVKTGAPKRRMRFVVANTTVREFDIELADGKPDFWVFSDVAPFKGKRLDVIVAAVPAGARALEAVTQGDDIKEAAALYHEGRRPQFHFTSRRGWLNDPNGLVYYDGEYHLFYQHNPYGWDWGNMHWGHAVSKDLVHWQELPAALYPQRFGDWCFSGSAVVDAHNTSGFQTGRDKVLAAAYTSTGRGESIAYSTDRGRTWTDYCGNPVVRHAGRDPQLLWHEPTKQWVMAVYDEHAQKQWIAFYTSPDLKAWQFQSRIEGFYECPNLFELPVDGADPASKWVLYAADGKYLLGSFDGKSFTPESGKHQLWYGNFYAAQTFSNAPDGQRIQVGWASGIAFPGMPFNQQMTIPCRLTLRKTPDGVRLFAEPVQQIETLHGNKHAWSDRLLKPDENLLQGLTGDLFDIHAELEPAGAAECGFTIRGVPVVYNAQKQELSWAKGTAPLKATDGKVRLRLLVDRGSIEIFGNDGRVAVSAGMAPAEDNHSLGTLSRGGKTRVRSLEVFELKSAWPQ